MAVIMIVIVAVTVVVIMAVVMTVIVVVAEFFLCVTLWASGGYVALLFKEAEFREAIDLS